MLKVTVVTCSYNSSHCIESAVRSVVDQTYTNIEHIIIDGGSSDGTLDIINKYKDKISLIVSEPDSGIFDAFNKGLNRSTGDIIAYLNSDDVYANTDVIANVVNIFQNEHPDVVCASINFFKPLTNKTTRKWFVGKFARWKLYFGWMPPHPGVFIKRKIAVDNGQFDISFKISGDYDYLARLLMKDISVVPSPLVVVNMATGGASNNSLENFNKKFIEDNRVANKNKLIPYLTPFLKRLIKIFQFRL